ncbi:MAG: hypothetical protein E4H01_03940 [Lysobacterales bacterium]|nr:MAG: hypothetical protein E4H01_03940 [Xanthomonadales bacterium]
MGHLYDAYARTVNKVFHSKEIGDYLFGKEANETGGKVLGYGLDYGRSLRGVGGNIKRTADMIDLTDEERAGLSYWQNVGVDVVGGLGQLTGQVLMYIVNPAAGLTMMGGQGVDQAADLQIKSGTLGRDFRSDLGLVIGGGVTLVTEKIGLDFLLKRLPPEIKSRLLRNFVDVAIAGGGEAIQEVTEGIMHGLNEYLTSNPDAEIIGEWDREALAGGGSAATFRMIMNALVPGRQGMTPVNAELRESVRHMNSQSGQDALESRIFLAQQSAVNKRAQKQFAEFIEKAGPGEYVFVRPDALRDLDGLADNITSQIDGTGANVAIPMKQFLTEIATDGATLEAMRPHITLRDGDMTKEELEQAAETTPEYIKRIVANAQKHEDDLVEAEQIYEQVKDQLIETRRQGEQTARMSAQLFPSIIVAHKAELAKMGKDVSIRELYEDMGLTIVGPEGAVGQEDIEAKTARIEAARGEAQFIAGFDEKYRNWTLEDYEDAALAELRAGAVAALDTQPTATGAVEITGERRMVQKYIAKLYDIGTPYRKIIEKVNEKYSIKLKPGPDGQRLIRKGEIDVKYDAMLKEPDFDNRRVYEQDMYELVNGKVGFKEDRIDFILRENAYADGRTKGFVAYIDPNKFVDAVTPDPLSRDRIREETADLNTTDKWGRDNDISSEIQTPFVMIDRDEESGQWRIDGHEGRHRMTALARAGYNQVPVIIRSYEAHEGVPWELEESGVLLGDKWTADEGEALEVYNVTPLTFKNRDRIASEFGVASKPSILFQNDQDLGDAEFTKEIEGVEVTEKYQDVWDYHQKRLSMVEQLKTCLTS